MTEQRSEDRHPSEHAVERVLATHTRHKDLSRRSLALHAVASHLPDAAGHDVDEHLRALVGQREGVKVLRDTASLTRGMRR